MAKEKPNKGAELISPDKIKKEPEDSTAVSGSKSSVVSKSITVLTSPTSSTVKTSTAQPKTILLVQTVNNRTGGIQSLLFPQTLRSLPATTSDLSLSTSRAKISTLLTVTSTAGKSQLSIAPKMAECLLTSATGIVVKPATPQVLQSQIQAQSDIKSIVKLSSAIPSAPQKVCELTFNSRTIKADGTVCTLKEYLCNFCQYKVASQEEFHEHFMTHIFSCNYCCFRAFTRYEVLSHKKEKHQGIAEELAGYEGLDSFSDQMNSLIAEWHAETPQTSTQLPIVSIQVPVVSTQAQVPVVSSQAPGPSTVTVAASETAVTTDSGGPPMVIVSSKASAASVTVSSVPSIRTLSSISSVNILPTPSLISVSRSFTLSTPVSQASQSVVTSVSTSSGTTTLLTQKKTVTTTASSPLILPVSTMKTTANVGKSNDNYFTYKIVHDAAGKVQAYECDVCSYRSTKMNEIFAHASTHSLNDLMKSNSVNVQWECFYCSFTSLLQANVVSHVIAKHPNKPIQLKRMVTNTAAQRSTSRSVLLRSPNFPSDPNPPVKTSPSPTVKKEKTLDEAPTAASISATSVSTKKTEEADDGCMWGCYYCSVQSVDRNEIIQHLKKDHAQQKLVITRRRITHIPVLHTSKTDGQQEATEVSNDLHLNDSETAPSERTNSDVQIGDIDSTDPQHSMLKSRRKQVFPRKVADDAKNEEAGETGTKATESTEAVVASGKSKRKFQNTPRPKESSEHGELKLPEVTTGKRTRRSEANSDEQSKRIKFDNGLCKETTKMVDLTQEVSNSDKRTEDSAPIVIDGQDAVEDASMPALEDVSKFVKLKPNHGKSTTEVLLSTEPTAVFTAVTNCTTTEVIPEPDKEMPILQPELCVPQMAGNHSFSKDLSSVSGNEEGNELLLDKDCPEDNTVNDTELFMFDNLTKEAHCNWCSVTIQGPNARNHMREHSVTHTGGHLWSCPKCPFKSGCRSLIIRHVRNKHKNCPIQSIQRKIYTKSSENNSSIGLSHACIQGKEHLSSSGVPQGKSRQHIATSRVQGPRSVKEKRMIQSSTHLWHCPFCGRRSLFKGELKIHVKVAHPAEDSEAKLKRLPRLVTVRRKKPICKEAAIDIVPIEDMHLYESLSTLLLDNGMSLIHDLDIDDDVDNPEDTIPIEENLTSQKYRCLHCHFRNLNLLIVKSHILQMHPGEMIVIDQSAGRRTHRHFLCRYPDCSFSASEEELLKTHSCKGLETEKPKLLSNNIQLEKIPTIGQESRITELQPLSEISARLRTHSKSQGNLDSDTSLNASLSEQAKSVDTSGSEGRHDSSNVTSNFRKRLKTPEGPIDYNDDGTLKGIELENGSMTLQCRYCDYPRTLDPVEIKVHLAGKHPRLQPIAIDVDAKEKGGLACLFVCSVFGCDYSSHYSNVFEHHMNLEHPDVESGARLVKKKKTHKRNSTEKFRIQTDVPLLPDQHELCGSKEITEETPATFSTKSSDDCATRELLPTATLASPSASTFSQPALSPVGTASSDASNAFGDGPALGSPDDVQVCDNLCSPKDTSRPPRKPRLKTLSFDYPCRYECIQCSFRIGSPEEMKSHLVVKHRENFRNFYCIDRRARELRKRQKVLFCRDVRCAFYCKFDEELENHEKYTCSFGPTARHHQKASQEQVLQYMDSVVKMNSGVVASEGEKLYQVGSSRGTMVDDANNKMYQCSHCTFITTDLHNIRMHVIAEHAATEGGFAEIKTELGTDGNIVMNVNDRGVNELVNKSALNMSLVCDKDVIRESRSMYDAVDTVKIDDEEKVYTVL